jgi:ElaB/YqjD/DUF883 family membrane-anchored ribosome-binding protein
MVRSEQTGEATADIQTIKEDIAKLRDDVSNLANMWVTRGRERLSDATGGLQETFQNKIDGATDWVRERPLQAIVIAGVAGLILGKILRR